MNILIGTAALFVIALLLWQRLESDENRANAVRTVRRMAVMNTPRVILALVSAGLFAELLPEEIVRAHLGDTSGIGGVLLGVGLGVLTPGGAFVSFALAAGAMRAGAAEPAMVAYITAWSLFALTKVIAEEMVFLRPRFILARVSATFFIPFLAGGLALLI